MINPRSLVRVGLLAVGIAASVSLSADTYPRQTGIDAFHYAFKLELSDASPEIVGEASVDLLFVRDGVASVALDLATPANGKGMTVTSVAIGGAAVKYAHANNRLTITLAQPPKAGEHRVFVIGYHGQPANGLRLIKNKFDEWCAFSENWPDRAREWLPMIDHPYDKATSEFVVTTPSKYQVVANGLLTEQMDLGDGRRLTHWKQSVPIVSWLNAIGVEQFYVHYAGTVKGVELSTWVAHQDKEIGPIYFEEPSRQAIDFFSEHIGPYQYEKLANVAAAGINGGTEHASAIFYGEKGLKAAPAYGLVYHEIAHQWFGDAVTENDWDDVWLSEGFATYFTHLCEEHYLGHDVMVGGLRRDITNILATQKTLPDAPVIHRNLADMSKVLNRLIYQKGGWTLHMLHGRIGDDAFWAGIRAYYRRYLNGNTTTDGFRQEMEKASGQDLRAFFTQWLTRPGIPKLEGSWRYDAATKRVEVTVSQTQAEDLYRLPIQIGVSDTETSVQRIEAVELAERSKTFLFAADKEPVAVVLDPKTWLLFEAGVFGKAR